LLYEFDWVDVFRDQLADLAHYLDW
jgi:hypothetical protein